MGATLAWMMRPASASRSARPRMSRSRCAGVAAGHGPFCARPGSRRVSRRLICALRVRGYAPGRCPGTALGTLQCPAPAAVLTSALPHLAVQARLELVRVTWRLPIRQVPGRSCAKSMTCLGAGPASGPLSGRLGHSGSALLELRFEHPGASALTDRCRAAPAAAAVRVPVVPLDRRRRGSCPATRSSRKRCRSTASWALPPAARQSPGPVSSVSWRDDYPVFHPIRAMELAPAPSGLMPCGGGVTRGQGHA
jgi:hypothetical protein